MKTSNKLLIGTFIVILLAMTYANFTVKKTLKEIKIREDIETTQQPDSIPADTVTNHINIQIK